MSGIPTDKRPTVLITRFSALGDVAMASAVVAAAARRHPEVRFVVVTRERFAALFPQGIEIAAIDLDGRHKGIAGLAKLARELKATYDPVAVADIHDVIRTRLLRNLLRLRGTRIAVIDKGRRDKKRLVRGLAHEQLRHSADRYADVLRALGYDPGCPTEAPLGAPAPAACPRIGIAPFAAHPGKAYPLEKMAKAADMIRASRPDAALFWFSAPGDEADRLARLLPATDTIVARLGLQGGLAGEIELMGSLDAMIAMDSGNMHLAALRGVPVVSVWGATHPLAGFAGATSPEDLRIQADLPCRPCSVYGNKPCRISGNGSFPCLDAISPDTIAAKTLSLISHR